MNENIIRDVSVSLGIKEGQARAVLKLLSEDNTVPFIARYRKEATGALDEDMIRKIDEVYNYQVNLSKRKDDVIRLIDEKGLLTDELKSDISKCTKLIEVEDIYRPFKEKKKTKATDAINAGLKVLAEAIINYQCNSLNEIDKYIKDKFNTREKVLEGVSYIIAEDISDAPIFHKEIRRLTYLNGVITSKIKKNAIDENKTYEMYYSYQEKVNQIRPHRVLALNRGEKDNVLNVSIAIDVDMIINYLNSIIIKNSDNIFNNLIKNSIIDSYKRLIAPSIERDIRNSLTETAEISSIDNFANNLNKLLLTPPIKEKIVLGVDPAFRTGCKLAVLDKTGKVLAIDVIYPTEPHLKIEESKAKVFELIEKYNIDIIAIGNGTASRETESFISDTIKEVKKKISYIIVSEAGASVYSASPLAISEFPNLTVEKRSAISIGRRLQDALAELVKIDPKSIGVGLYQHDLSEKKLGESLNFVVTKVVNEVGVNINTSSSSLLSYVSGLTKKVINNIINYRDQHGFIKNREELKKITSVTDKVYEQSIGFLRILNGDNPLDKTGIHPESYEATIKLLDSLLLTTNDLGSDDLKTKIANVNIEDKAVELGIDQYTLKDIITCLIEPGRDPRDEMPKPLLRSDILTIDDLKIGDELHGTVRNVVDFGVFIDIGLKNDGLAHISNLTNKFIKHPSDILSVGDIVDCYVIDIFKDKKKVALSLIKK